MIKTVKTPFLREFFEYVNKSKSSIKISSPFIKEEMIEKLYENKNRRTKLNVITKFSVINFMKKLSDLTAIEKIVKNEDDLKNMSNLHAKIYIFDDRIAFITSANLTTSGLIKNYEYGIITDDREIIKNVCYDFYEIYLDKAHQTIGEDHIKTVREIIKNIPIEKKITIPGINKIFNDDKEEIYYGGTESIEKSLSGWKLEVFKRLNRIDSDKFTSKDIYEFKSEFEKIYKNNTEIEAKIRQQLQFLRDLGLLEFLRAGEYKKLWT